VKGLKSRKAATGREAFWVLREGGWSGGGVVWILRGCGWGVVGKVNGGVRMVGGGAECDKVFVGCIYPDFSAFSEVISILPLCWLLHFLITRCDRLPIPSSHLLVEAPLCFILCMRGKEAILSVLPAILPSTLAALSSRAFPASTTPCPLFLPLNRPRPSSPAPPAHRTVSVPRPLHSFVPLWRGRK